jgi:hypothetical protein
VDDETARALARYQHRMANADRLYRLAEIKREAADKLEHEVALPDHERPVGDETTKLLEARLLRQEADELTQAAEGLQQRLHEPSIEQDIEAWAARQERGWDRQR